MRNIHTSWTHQCMLITLFKNIYGEGPMSRVFCTISKFLWIQKLLPVTNPCKTFWSHLRQMCIKENLDIIDKYTHFLTLLALNRESYEDTFLKMIQYSITKKPEAHLYKKMVRKGWKDSWYFFLDYSDVCLSKQKKNV